MMMTRLLDILNRRGKGLAVRLVVWTGKAPYPVHPKHLAPVEGHGWYLKHLRPSDTLLDYGCGQGHHTIKAKARVAFARGIDSNPDHIVVAWRLSSGIENIRFQRADSLEPFFPRSWTVIMLLDVLEHVSDRRRLLRQIHKGLTGNGRLIISVPNTGTSWRRRLRHAGLFDYQDRDHKIEYTRQTLAQELHAAGFCCDMDTAEPIVYDTPWAGLIDVIGGIHLGLYSRLMRWKRRMALEHPEESTGFRVVARKR
jgi:SAM-dependent methyltransferase